MSIPVHLLNKESCSLQFFGPVKHKEEASKQPKQGEGKSKLKHIMKAEKLKTSTFCAFMTQPTEPRMDMHAWANKRLKSILRQQGVA